jgi:iron-sulfur cluster insertion protein
MTQTTAFTISDSASKRITHLVSQEKENKQYLRVAIVSGGCSGMQYTFNLDHTVNPEDTIIEKNGAKVIIDDVSLEILKGSELDYIEEMIGSYFSIKNPNASSSCGCGSSFSI